MGRREVPAHQSPERSALARARLPHQGGIVGLRRRLTGQRGDAPAQAGIGQASCSAMSKVAAYPLPLAATSSTSCEPPWL